MAAKVTAGELPGDDAGVWKYIGGSALFVVFVLYGLPIFWMVTTSFKSFDEVANLTWLPSRLDFTPYVEFFRTDFLPALRNSAIIATTATLFSMALAVPAAYGLCRVQSRLVSPILLLILVVQMIPTSAMFTPLFQVLATLGLVNTLTGVALAISTLMVPFATLIMRPAFQAIPVEIEEASRVDGASPARYLFSVAAPLVQNTAVVTAAIVFVASWAELLYPLTFLLDADKYPLSVYIAESAGRFNNTWNSLMAVSTMASLPVLVVVIAARNRLQEGLTLGAVK